MKFRCMSRRHNASACICPATYLAAGPAGSMLLKLHTMSLPKSGERLWSVLVRSGSQHAHGLCSVTGQACIYTSSCLKPVMLPAAPCAVGVYTCACTSACVRVCCLLLYADNDHDGAYTYVPDGSCVALQLNINVTNKDAKLRSQEDE